MKDTVFSAPLIYGAFILSVVTKNEIDRAMSRESVLRQYLTNEAVYDDERICHPI